MALDQHAISRPNEGFQRQRHHFTNRSTQRCPRRGEHETRPARRIGRRPVRTPRRQQAAMLLLDGFSPEASRSRGRFDLHDAQLGVLASCTKAALEVFPGLSDPSERAYLRAGRGSSTRNSAASVRVPGGRKEDVVLNFGEIKLLGLGGKREGGDDARPRAVRMLARRPGKEHRADGHGRCRGTDSRWTRAHPRHERGRARPELSPRMTGAADEARRMGFGSEDVTSEACDRGFPEWQRRYPTAVLCGQHGDPPGGLVILVAWLWGTLQGDAVSPPSLFSRSRRCR